MAEDDPALSGASQSVAGTHPHLLFLCDHASNRLPPGVALGVADTVMDDHVAWDIGAAALTETLAAHFRAPAILAGWSRLLVDCNRPPDMAVPESSDGIPIPANIGLSAADRAARLAIHRTYHAAIEQALASHQPTLLVSVHSFTPALASAAAPRPWPIALLWNVDDRATRPALKQLRAVVTEGPVGANEPYSGRILNYTMDRHAEANGIPYLGFEVRQDLLADAAGIARWAGVMAGAIDAALAEIVADVSSAGNRPLRAGAAQWR